MITYIIAGVAGIAVGAVVGRIFLSKGSESEIEALRESHAASLDEASTAAEARVRAELERLSEDSDAELETLREALKGREEKLQTREEGIERRDEQLGKRESQMNRRDKDLGRRERKIERQEEEVESAAREARERLEGVAGMSPEEARAIVEEEVREEARRRCVDEVRSIEREARTVAQERARMIVGAAIQRYASEHVADRTVSSVTLPSEDMKGRIIGREGRNIRAFEASTGCDLVIDDAPDTVLVSSFNPVRREIARMSLQRLLKDGRIHPARIEEVVSRARQEMGTIIRKKGDAAALELEISGLHGETVKALGRLHFATSFAQNVLRHSVEVGALAGMMASELGLKPAPFRRAGLLHDIGKAVEHDAEGGHAEVGAAFLRKRGENKAVVAAVAAHENPELQKTLLDLVIGAANALSCERPGARSESLANYIRRLEDLEKLVGDMKGVESVFALESGKQLRVMVDNAKLNDRDADLLSREIARRIEREVSHAGEVRVTVIRQTRAVQYAR